MESINSNGNVDAIECSLSSDYSSFVSFSGWKSGKGRTRVSIFLCLLAEVRHLLTDAIAFSHMLAH